MPFDFEKYKRKLELDGFKFSKKTSKKYTDWFAKKKKLISSDFRFFRIFESEPDDRDLQKFVNDSKRIYEREDPSEIFLIAPKCDNYALRKFIEKTGFFTKHDLNKLITFKRSTDKISREIRRKVIEEEMKKPEVIKKFLKPTEDFKVFKKVCKYAKTFEITKLMKSKEINIEQNFWTYLKAKFGKREEIVYEKPKGTGRLDIYLPKRKIGVELKLIKGRADLDRLFGQIHRYKDDYNFMCVILVNIKGYPLSEFKQIIKPLKELGNVEVIVR